MSTISSFSQEQSITGTSLTNLNNNNSDSSSFSTTILRDFARKELIDILDSIRGKKSLVIDPSISGSLSLIAEFSLLKEHGVENIYHLQSGRFNIQCQHLVFICRPKMMNMTYIRDIILDHRQNANNEIQYYIYFVPRRTMICERVLEDAGVYGDVTIGEYHLDIVPLDDDLLSMELENSFKDLFLDGDMTSLYYVAKALLKLQTIVGIIPKIIGKGKCANYLKDTLFNLRKELEANHANSISSIPLFPLTSEIDSLIILDRSVDLITPMCTQLTYEGLIDEVYGIKSTFVELDSSLVGLSQNNANISHKLKKIPLNSNDKLFSQLRDMNFAVVGGILSQVARRIQDDYEGRHQVKTVSQIRDFIGKLNNLRAEHQSLRLHTNMTEEIRKYTLDQDFNKFLEVQQNFVAGITSHNHVEYIEEMINNQQSIQQTIRLLGLLSLVSGGVRAKSFEFFRKEIVQTYGYQHIITLDNLSKVGLFKKYDGSKNTYPSVRKNLKIIVDDVDEYNPNDISYVYSGYAPISVRLIQCACLSPNNKSMPMSGTTSLFYSTSLLSSSNSNAYTSDNNNSSSLNNNNNNNSNSNSTVSWKGWEEVLKLLPGPLFEEEQAVPSNSIYFNKKNQNQRKISIVLFLGGCTFTEISSLRFLSQQEDIQRDFIILTTDIINGNTLVDSLINQI
ncbi:vacuolar protein sorting-associated protein 33A-like protein [Piromyces finnis]|uniref:Vacuolar protein sorting-associated protein 33A-like protein n=1 Tax=Piromyces finnis TaxID=1754191 RepID=A0A1Y1VJ85_9FUNG|nr:vacuolar protein sorting-associated protein 33A-like protein [Piromyces finnis]|eukprot:ORX57239.1 vacuolar protein sorting-associated protein 33A-like protein [Piromyces finnis]